MVGRRRRRIVVEIDADSRRARRELRRAEFQVRRFQRNVSRAAGRVGLAFGGAGVAAVTLASQYETQFARIQGLVGLTTSEVDRLREATLALGGETGRGPRELADSLFLATSAGFRGAEALRITELSGRAAAIGLGSAAQVTDALTAALSSYGSEALNAGQAADILARAVEQGRLSADELAGSIGPLSGLAANLGISFDNLNAGIAALSRVTSTSEAATQLRGILVTLTRPSAEAATALESVGLSADALRASFADGGLLGGLEGLIAAGIPLEQVFRDTQALAGALQLSGPAAEANQQIFDALADSTGKLDEAFQVVAETSEFQLRRELARLESEGIRLGQVALPAVSDALSVLSTVGGRTAVALAELPTAIAAVTAAVGVGGIGALVAGPRIGGAVRGIRNLNAALTTIATTGAGARASLAGIGAVLTGPTGAAIVATVAAIGVGWTFAADEIRRAREEAERLRDITLESDPGARSGARIRESVRVAADEARLTAGQRALLPLFGAGSAIPPGERESIRLQEQIREALAQLLPTDIPERFLADALSAAQAAARPDLAAIGRDVITDRGRRLAELSLQDARIARGAGRTDVSGLREGLNIFGDLADRLSDAGLDGQRIVGQIIDIGSTAATTADETQDLNRELLTSTDVVAVLSEQLGDDFVRSVIAQAESTGDWTEAIIVLDERMTGVESATDAASDSAVELADAEMDVAEAADIATAALTATEAALRGLTSPVAAGFGAPAAEIDFRRSLGRLQTAVADGLADDIPELVERLLADAASAIEAAGPGARARGVAQTALTAATAATGPGGFSEAEQIRIRQLINQAGNLTLARVRGQETGAALEPIFDPVSSAVAVSESRGPTEPAITYNNFFVEAGADRVARQQELSELAADEGTRRR